MSRLPILNAREIIRALEKAGFEKQRQKGSHAFMRHPNGNTTLVPLHPDGMSIGFFFRRSSPTPA